MNHVIFTNNIVTETKGSIALRGKMDEPTETCTVTGNTFHNYNSTGSAWFWGSIELNNCKDIQIKNNIFKNAFKTNDFGNGHAL